jgi:uncharacterized membrane protein YeaQ/YmgE (transglycosylase-associated protein family)
VSSPLDPTDLLHEFCQSTREGRELVLSTEILARIFRTFAADIHCTVLNACNSDRQAEVIAEQIYYVVGMSQPILDKAALQFAVSFYKELAAQKTIEQAYEMGCIAIQIECEKQSQRTQFRQYRDLTTVGEDEQSTSPLLLEYQKPVLFKGGIRWNPGTAENVSALLDRSEEFVEFVHQVSDRKDYKDLAREAYDNFGQFSSQNTVSLSKIEYKQRQILIGKVKEFWIEGFLEPSLKGVDALRLEMKARPDAIADLTQGIEALAVELDASYDQIRQTQIYEEMGQGRTLLILGEPGSGKTIALLQLEQRLINRSEQNLNLPIPIVFNLSSWAKDRKSIVDWLIDELREKYQVSKSLSEPWIKQQQLILLLDGLDEVSQDYRNNCVRALNEFIGLFPQTEMAVCSRVRDYEALTEHLQISSALCLQPCSSEQVYQVLDGVGGSLVGLKTLMKRDAELEKFAQTPLILYFMREAYQGWSVEKLIPQLRSTSDRQQNLFNTYIDRRLERGATSEYSKEDEVLPWLRWLASQMVREKQTIFLIEKIQPSWLEARDKERNYRIWIFIFTSFFTVLIFGLCLGLTAKLMGVRDWQRDTLLVGLITSLITGLITSLPTKISPLERLSWSWQRARFIDEFFLGFCYGLLLGLLLGLIAGWLKSPSNVAQIFVVGRVSALMGASILSLLFGLGSGLDSLAIVQRTVPNQGIRTSLRNSLFIGLSAGLIAGLISGLPYGLGFGLFNSLILGLIFGLKKGGAACIQHLILRQMLYKKGCIPWNYEKFLNFVSLDRPLMKKVGGGYIFFHRMLLEHLAPDLEGSQRK